MSTVAKEMGIKKLVTGDVGIEIEVEGTGLPVMAKYWNNEQDGSLQGPESREYVLKRPMTLVEAKSALDHLDNEYKRWNTTVNDSVRAGVHIHINCQHLTMTQLYNFMTVYLILENVLVKWCGDSRCGNLFCLRASDAEWILTQIRHAASTKKFINAFHRDELRYSSMNVKALGDYGSLEFRSMRGTRDLGLIYMWAETLLGLREFAKKFNNPADIIEAFSIQSPLRFMRNALGDNYDSFKTDGQEKMLWTGVHNAQDIAFCADWSKFDPKMRKIGELEFPEDMNDIDEPEDDF
jgi:hypothetical protein